VGEGSFRRRREEAGWAQREKDDVALERKPGKDAFFFIHKSRGAFTLPQTLLFNRDASFFIRDF